MDARTSSVCRKLEKELSGGRTHFAKTCGLLISTYFNAMKLIWLMENVDSVKHVIELGDALFGTIDIWLIWNHLVNVVDSVKKAIKSGDALVNMVNS
ncbi:hypothetical protein QYF36_024807 [Acer negundo]|nr:hypothetical protein QYF36_024807 [Acer negundo]